MKSMSGGRRPGDTTGLSDKGSSTQGGGSVFLSRGHSICYPPAPMGSQSGGLFRQMLLSSRYRYNDCALRLLRQELIDEQSVVFLQVK